MSYENAPATYMLATHCAFCGRPLVDAQSVETGVGPICRSRWMVADRVSAEARKEGNKLIYLIAKSQKGEQVDWALDRMTDLGFVEAVKRIKRRLGKLAKKRASELVVITIENGRLSLKADGLPDSSFRAFLARVREIPGRMFADGKNTFPVAQKRAVWELLCGFFKGRAALGPKGPFIIGEEV